MPSKSVANSEVKIGQMWRDNNPRANGRLIKITCVGEYFIEVCSPNTGITTEIAKCRFLRSSAKRGYSLVAEPAPASEAVPTTEPAQNV